MNDEIASTVAIIVKLCFAFVACRGRGLKEDVALMWFALETLASCLTSVSAIVPRGQIGHLLPLNMTKMSPPS